VVCTPRLRGGGWSGVAVLAPRALVLSPGGGGDSSRGRRASGTRPEPRFGHFVAASAVLRALYLST
jgi:hypothetical protein